MIYFDCAATSLQKPREVYGAVQRAMRTMASPGRGGYGAAMQAADTVYACREELAGLFHVPSPEQVVFTSNATHGLNIAIASLVSRGDRVVVSGYEHNSVMRPLTHLGAEIIAVRTPLFEREAMVEGFRNALVGAKAAVCTAMSNVFGYITPIEEIARLCRQMEVPLIVDASQAAGCVPLDFLRLGADFMAMPGHKGLLGPQGTGVLLCREPPKPLMMGGTGSDSRQMQMPELLPDCAEAGTHNVPGIAGLLAGVRYLRRVGVAAVGQHESALARQFALEAKRIPEVELFYRDDPHVQGGIVSLRHGGLDCELLAEALGERGICVRGGLHCAPSAHETCGTLGTGTLRFSFSPFHTSTDVKQGITALKYSVNNLKT